MPYNLTETQKKLARFLVENVQAGHLPETLYAEESSTWQNRIVLSDSRSATTKASFRAKLGALDALAAASLIVIHQKYDSGRQRGSICTLTGLIYSAVASNVKIILARSGAPRWRLLNHTHSRARVWPCALPYDTAPLILRKRETT